MSNKLLLAVFKDEIYPVYDLEPHQNTPWQDYIIELSEEDYNAYKKAYSEFMAWNRKIGEMMGEENV